MSDKEKVLREIGSIYRNAVKRTSQWAKIVNDGKPHMFSSAENEASLDESITHTTLIKQAIQKTVKDKP